MEDFEFQLSAEKKYGEGSPPREETITRTYIDPTDGVVYEWDSHKQGWFPKIDEDFLAVYQASYGVSEPDSDVAAVTQSTSAEATTGNKDTTGVKAKDSSESDKSTVAGHTTESGRSEKDIADTSNQDKKDGDASETGRKRKTSEGSGWFDIDDDHNHNLYVSGLPPDITNDEFLELVSKCGIIMEDEEGNPKIKLYKDVNGEPKGDGLCSYLKVESIDLALQLLDQSTHRGHTLTVQRAKFQMKGEYNPSLKKKKKNKGKKKGSRLEKLLDWKEHNVEGPKRIKSEKVVIFKHLFNPKEFEDDPMAINDIRDDLRQECEKFGVVKKILIFDRHPDGVGSVAFKEFESADLCVQKLNGRWFGGQKLMVNYWDGATNYQIEETDQEREQRLKKWEHFLKEGHGGEGKDEGESGEGNAKIPGKQKEEHKA